MAIRKQTADYFNEAFLGTLDRERKLQQQRDLFNKEMSFKRRQLDLNTEISQGWLDARRQELSRLEEQQALDRYALGFKKIDQPVRKNIRTGQYESEVEGKVSPVGIDLLNIGGKKYAYDPPVEAPKELLTKDPRVGADGYVHRWNPNTKQYEKTNLKAKEDRVITSTEETTPYTKQVDLDRAWDFYNELKGAKRTGETYSYYSKNNDLIPDASEEQYKIALNRAKSEVEALTDDKAKWYNQHYANFDQTYRKIKERTESGGLPLSELSKAIAEMMPNAPLDVKQAMEDLLTKRTRFIF